MTPNSYTDIRLSIGAQPTGGGGGGPGGGVGGGSGGGNGEARPFDGQDGGDQMVGESLSSR